jgi:prepilin peptidase CpaA
MPPYDTVAVGIAVVACASDLHNRRIPNLLTLGAAAAAFLLAAAHGLPTFQSTVIGWLIGLGLWLPVYALGGMGAGDVKLIAAIGAWLGPLGAVHAALYSAVAGGLMALVVALVHGYLREACANIRLVVTHWCVVGFAPAQQLTLEGTAGPRLAYALPTLVGTAVAVWLR